MRAFRFHFAVAVVVATLATGLVTADAKWTRVDTTNFIVIGAAGEQRLRGIGTQFEGFREALTRLLSSNVTRTAVPTVVIAFPDGKSFQPFKPAYQGKTVDVGGLFLPRRDVNYILLGPDTTSDALRPVFHEYTHVIVNNVAPELPVWLNEGLAEYYSTFEIGNDGRTVTFGRLIESHIRELAQQAWLPLNELLATKHDSPHYNEGSRRGVFYAESWLLVHMLLHGQPDRRPAFSGYTRELSTGVPPDAAWQHHFGNDDVYKAVRLYAGRSIMSARQFTLSDQIVRAPAVVVPLAPHDLETTLGEVLSAEQRPDLAAERFDRALVLQPGAARAMVGKAHAKNEVPRLAATTGAPADWFGDYMIGATLLEHSEAIDRASLDAARAALGRVVVARPDLPNAYVLFAMASDKVDADPKPAVDALSKAHVAVPARDDYTITLAHALMRMGDFAGARSVLGGILARPHLPGARDAAAKAMAQVAAAEQLAVTRAAADAARAAPQDTASSTTAQAAEPQPVFRTVGPGEHRVEGRLQRIQCSPKRIEFFVDVGDRVAHFQAGKMDKVEFLTYRTDLQGSVACGARTPADPVYVTVRPGELDGTVVAIEFLPQVVQPKQPAPERTQTSQRENVAAPANSDASKSAVPPVFREVAPDRVEGRLQRVDCLPTRVEFVVDIGERVVRFQAASLELVKLTTYQTNRPVTVTCGERTPSDPVYVTRRPGDLDGTVVAIEFVRR